MKSVDLQFYLFYKYLYYQFIWRIIYFASVLHLFVFTQYFYGGKMICAMLFVWIQFLVLIPFSIWNRNLRKWDKKPSTKKDNAFNSENPWKKKILPDLIQMFTWRLKTYNLYKSMGPAPFLYILESTT